MIETRGTVTNLLESRKKVETLGFTFKGEYAFLDMIYFKDDEILRLRIYSKSNRKQKDCQLIRKSVSFKGAGKIDKISLKKEFNNKEQAMQYIARHVIDFIDNTEYSRKGIEFVKGKNHIYLEDIQFLGHSVEIEAENEEELKALVKKIQFKKILKQSLPYTIRNIIKR